MAKTLAELENQNIKWHQTSFWKEQYELRAEDGAVLGTMRRSSMWKSRYEVDAVGNRWQFEPKGFWRRRIEITATASGDQPAIFSYERPGGVLRYPDGRVFIWRKTSFWVGSKWVWTTEDGEPLIGFRQGGGFRVHADISINADIAPEKASQKAPSLLIFLGWYLITLFRQQQAATVAVVAGA